MLMRHQFLKAGGTSGINALTLTASGNTIARYDFTAYGDAVFDNGTSTTVSVKCDDSGVALIRANGDGQGTGAVEVGQSDTYGGGICYNGDGSPSFVNGETADNITFYRLSGGTRTEVFHYPYSNNNVTFNGSITSASNITAYSDERLKSKHPNARRLKKVLQMRGVSFTKDGEAGSGVIAQELELIASELVHTADDEMGTKSVAYGNLVGYLIENAKQQQTEIDELKALVKTLMEK